MSSSHRFDIVGLGALNVDHILSRNACERLAQADPSRLDRLRERFDGESDARVASDAIDRMATLMKGFEVVSLGGSGFNTIRTVRALSPRFRLGYVGVVAIPRHGESDFDEWFRSNGIDRRLVINVPGDRQGACAALFDKGGRRLRSNAGIDAKFAEQFQRRTANVVEYLSSSRVVHLTPSMDDRSPALIVEWLSAMKAREARTTVSVDPGFLWSRPQTGALSELYRYVDVLFVNEPELRCLAEGPSLPTGPKLIDAFVLRRHLTSPLTIVIKRDTETIICEFDGANLALHAYPIENLLSEGQIEDSTGAGDVFAGGFLAARFILDWELPDCVDLGHRLMRAKLQGAGLSEDHSFPAILTQMRAAVA